MKAEACNAVARKASAEPTGSSGAGMPFSVALNRGNCVFGDEEEKSEQRRGTL